MNRSIVKEIWESVFRGGNRLYQFIGINVLVFLGLNLLLLLTTLRVLPNHFSAGILAQFQLPAYFPFFLTKPWTLITYMFTQISFFHLLFNVLWLYWMGRIFLSFLSQRQFFFVYVLGGLAGAIVYFLSYAYIPFFQERVTQHYLIGSSASVSAVIFAAATLVPNYTINLLFFGNVKLKYLALVFLLLDILGVGGGNGGGNLAHLGGCLFGYLYILQLRKGRDWSVLPQWKNRKRKLKVVHFNVKETSSKKSTPPKNVNAEEGVDQAYIDQILDKISTSGYESLNQKEKEALFKASKDQK